MPITNDPRLNVIIPDLHGVLRGLSAPLRDKPSLIEGKPLYWSSSLFSSRFDGGVSEGGLRGIAYGDPDYPCYYIANSLQAVGWDAGDEQAVFAMYLPDSEPDYLDPRHVLAYVLNTLSNDGIDVKMACEFEFYLLDANHNAVGNAPFCELYSLDALAEQHDFFSLLRHSCKQQSIEIGNIISEYAPGQWEVNLNHTDPLTACLEGILLRRAIRTCAKKTNQTATFMAKPFSGTSGSGMHIHVSLYKDGKNLLTDKNLLDNAIAGVLEACAESTLFYAPFDNSYRRFMADSYAPIAINWAVESRAATVRIPHADSENSIRFEHRLAGADCNPYLVAASVLAGAHWGLNNNATPPPAGQPHAKSLPMTWHAAIAAFESATILPHYLPSDSINNYSHVKKDEWQRHRALITEHERAYYSCIL